MPVTPLDLALNSGRALDVEFDGGAVLKLTYNPSKYTGDVERVFGMHHLSGRELTAYAYVVSQLVESWDLTFGDDESVTGFHRLAEGETSTTVEHGLGFKPKVTAMERFGGPVDVKEYVKKLNADTFDIVLTEPLERPETFYWTLEGLGGKTIPLRFEILSGKLGFALLSHIWQAIEADMFPNRRAFRRSSTR